MEKVTACLLNYKRPDELREIEKHLRSFPFIDEVLIWDNSGKKNVINYGRYLAAKAARNEIIYTQDDDCIIENVASLYSTFVALNGEKMVNGMKPERASAYRGKDSIVGWGAFFRREWASVLNKYIAKWGEDYIFHRETDRIFTVLCPVERLQVDAVVKDFSSAMAPYALSLQREHEQVKAAALTRAYML